jgi:hypothetical protein
MPQRKERKAMGVLKKLEKALGLRTEHREHRRRGKPRAAAKKKSRRRTPPRGANGRFKKRG